VTQLLLAIPIAAVAIVVALVVAKRTDANAQPEPSGYAVPAVLDRNDFDRPDAPWLVVVFSSATCLSCKEAIAKAELLESDAVAVQDVEVGEHRELHERYRIDAVPMVLVVDRDGDVKASFLGPPPASELWAAVAEVRDAAEEQQD
jgi:hypothetical protein